MGFYNRILKLIIKQRKKGVVIFASNHHGESAGMHSVWAFDVDESGRPIFQSDAQKAKWDIATGTYSWMFDKFVTKG